MVSQFGGSVSPAVTSRFPVTARKAGTPLVSKEGGSRPEPVATRLEFWRKAACVSSSVRKELGWSPTRPVQLPTRRKALGQCQGEGQRFKAPYLFTSRMTKQTPTGSQRVCGVPDTAWLIHTGGTRLDGTFHYLA